MRKWENINGKVNKSLYLMLGIKIGKVISFNLFIFWGLLMIKRTLLNFYLSFLIVKYLIKVIKK